MDPGCRVDVSTDGSVAVVRVAGELDVLGVPLLREGLKSLAEQGIHRVIVDLAELDFVDSTGLGVLIGGLKRMRESDGDLVLKDLRPRVARVFEIAGLDQVFTVV
jgi:anti-sigma B factor antagonist